ncbi:heat shock factor protein-like isoform X2 [Mizuhopecten yessoensis]|uniref:heat shock factor protein-like isoform X2 n=1 Tax=Mizuhopecten yessoensis TaxID=6573 RepID=UPI000B45B4F6|nr:heat shock factor protein-like isoform X2 [Mizuhopecten yessoensis]
MHSSSGMSSSNVPAFLTKLWALVENPTCDDLISWDQTGNSFHVYEQARFSKEILPLYFKHSNIASFIRQLNMYGFRKVVHIDTGLKTEKDDVEFQHPYFIRGQEHLLENIKRKISGTVPIVKTEAPDVQNDVGKVLTEVVVLKGKQETMSSRLDTVKRENELLWREVASLRQKHIKQQQIVNKLIQFLVHLVGGNRGLSGMKRKMGMPLMIGDSEEPSNKLAKYSKSMQSVPAKTAQNYSVQSPQSQSKDFDDQGSGVIIHDVTEMVKKDTATAAPVGGLTNVNPVEEASTSALRLMPEDLSLPEDITNLTSDLVDNMAMFTEGMYPDISGISTDALSEVISRSTGQAKSSDAEEEINQTPLSISVNHVSNSNVAPQNPPVHTLSRQPSVSEMSEHLDSLQFDIDSLKDVLCGGQYSVDPNFLLGLFNPDSPPVTISPEMFSGEAGPALSKEEEDPSKSNFILGNEVIQYKPSDDVIPDLFDLADLSQAEDDPLSNSSVDCFKSKALETPTVQVSSDELDID